MWESLLSTVGKEYGMLDDMHAAISALKTFAFQLYDPASGCSRHGGTAGETASEVDSDSDVDVDEGDVNGEEEDCHGVPQRAMFR